MAVHKASDNDMDATILLIESDLFRVMAKVKKVLEKNKLCGVGIDWQKCDNG